MTDLVFLRGGGVSLAIDLSGLAPEVIHWGADLGSESAVPTGLHAAVPHSSYDEPEAIQLFPQASTGWRGRPALLGHRHGRDFSPLLSTISHRALGSDGHEIALADFDAALSVTIELHLGAEGMLRARSTVRNDGADDYSLQQLSTVLPLGPEAEEILDLSGRWCREQHPQRRAITQGTWLRSFRHGRTGHDSSVLFAAGSAGFANRSGTVWAAHLGFSGNHEIYLEKTAGNVAMMGMGELLAPGEVTLAPGESYATPWSYAAYSERGIDGITASFHRWMRARPGHPSSLRPVVLNTWEAVYFNHDLAELTELAERAQEVGAERFVLDDGWFRHRRNDTAGLGDWFVDDGVWPRGLAPLIEAVTSRGMQFGLWVEPEMVNEDSDVIRAHPDWISGPGKRIPPRWRNQQVLDLVNPEAWQYVYDRLDALLSENDISYLKWDQNRDLTEMGHDGLPSTHEQTLAAYRLFDALREAHPGVEIESCSSGGARVDLGILDRTDRVWASDCNDALERQTIQRWTQAVLPPELVGSHVGPPTSHTTGRTHDLSFRAITAMFGHFGMEWDIREAQGEVLAELKDAVALYKKHRALLHSGVAVHADLVDPAFLLHGVVAQDDSEALFAFVSVASSAAEHPGRVQFPGLDPERRYRVTVAFPTGRDAYVQRTAPSWIADGFEATGLALTKVGLPMPILNPEHAIVLEVAAT
ncbi:alpha-galactosidase [Parafrigoribacterium soli]|uniref:alpha-galactosidase n=1 Tax=Parafrigoribacterium soli TaxID=3144663 RepID=UPI0032EAC3BF